MVDGGAGGAAHPGECLDNDDVFCAVDLADGFGQDFNAFCIGHFIGADAWQSVAVFGFCQSQLGDVPRESGLRDAEALLEQRVAKLLLRGDAPLAE